MEISCRVVALFTLALLLLSLSGVLYIRHQILHIHGALVLRSNFHITEACLQCICEAGTECCESAKFKNGQICSSYRISQSYWMAAGMLILEGTLDDFVNLETAYLRCVSNPLCAARTVNSYVGKHMLDCDGNGLINCYDYAKIHILGHRNCSEQQLPPMTDIRLRGCLNELSVI